MVSVLSFSKLTLELGLGSTLQSPLADQTTSRIAAELGMRSSLEKRFAISCYRDDVKKE